MSSQAYSNKEHFYVKVRSTDLDAPQLVDQIGRELLDHLIACRTCSAVFAAQKNSIGEAGCVDGRRIVSESQVRWQERRFTLALRHVIEETLDEYLFDRLTADEREALAYHTQFCSQCVKEILERETLISCMKVVFEASSVMSAVFSHGLCERVGGLLSKLAEKVTTVRATVTCTAALSAFLRHSGTGVSLVVHSIDSLIF